MIKTIKISAVVSIVLLIGGVIFKSQHLMGANVVFTIGVVVGFLTAGLIVSFFTGKASSGLEKINIVFSSLAIILILFGFLFKIMHWPGAGKLIWIVDISILISGTLFLIDGLKEKDPVKSVLKIISMFFILFLLLLIVITA